MKAAAEADGAGKGLSTAVVTSVDMFSLTSWLRPRGLHHVTRPMVWLQPTLILDEEITETFSGKLHAPEVIFASTLFSFIIYKIHMSEYSVAQDVS